MLLTTRNSSKRGMDAHKVKNCSKLKQLPSAVRLPFATMRQVNFLMLLEDPAMMEVESRWWTGGYQLVSLFTFFALSTAVSLIC